MKALKMKDIQKICATDRVDSVKVSFRKNILSVHNGTTSIFHPTHPSLISVICRGTVGNTFYFPYLWNILSATSSHFECVENGFERHFSGKQLIKVNVLI